MNLYICHNGNHPSAAFYSSAWLEPPWGSREPKNFLEENLLYSTHLPRFGIGLDIKYVLSLTKERCCRCSHLSAANDIQKAMDIWEEATALAGLLITLWRCVDSTRYECVLREQRKAVHGLRVSSSVLWWLCIALVLTVWRWGKVSEQTIELLTLGNRV